jgi:hypothetical protein
MTKYNSLARQRPIKKPERPNPIWRGIGCLIIIIVPLMSFAAAKLLIDYGLQQGWAIPNELLGYPKLPEELDAIPSIKFLLSPITRWPNSYAYLTLSLVFIMFFGGLLSFIYALAYRFVGPPRWGPYDLPPTRGVRTRPYKR